jgi:hypothetical protein
VRLSTACAALLLLLQPGCAADSAEKPDQVSDGSTLPDQTPCEDTPRCRRPPDVSFLADPVWPMLDWTGPKVPPPFQAKVTTADASRFVLTPTTGKPISVSWGIASAPPPFKVGQIVQVNQCMSNTMNGRSAGVVRALDGTLLYAGAQGLEFPSQPFVCLPGTLTRKHVDPGCCANPLIKNEDCGEARNTGLRFNDTITLWPGEEGALTIGGEAYVAWNVYSFINNWSKRCSCNEDTASAWVVARKAAP